MSRQKGNKTEREGESLYEAVGYVTERSVGQRWDRTDWFGIIDIMAVQPGRPVHFCQVKTKVAAGIEDFVLESERLFPREHVQPEYLVRHPGQGGHKPTPPRWRLIRPVYAGEEAIGYETIVDEREDDVRSNGEGVIEFLREEVGDGR